MKKLTLIISLLVLTFVANAKDKEKQSDSKMPDRLNAVKLNLIGLGYKNLALQYERVLGSKISAACQLRYTFSGNMPFSSTLEAASSDSLFEGIKMGGWAITPEFRFYPRHAMKGFYLAPYLRFRQITMDYPLSYVDDNNKTQNIVSSGKFFSYGGGLMIGSHFNIGKFMSLDWFIIGVQYLNTNADFSATMNPPISNTDVADVKADLADIKADAGSFFKKMEYGVTNTNLSITGKFGSIGLRGFGLNIGYRF